ncbi:MAG: response regulator [Prevotella sp.]|nr:response regulator [Prevotella sp.]
MKKKRYILSALLLLATAVLIIRADVSRLYTSDRLSSSLIDCVVQDKYGYLWIGTEYGLNKFDGYRFTNYFSSVSDSLTIVDNEVVKVYADPEGRLWVGSSKGLARYDYEHNNFVRYRFPENQRPRVNSLLVNSKGDLLIGTAGYGLYFIRKGQNRITKSTSYRKRRLDDFYSRVFEDEQHNLWRSSHESTFTRVKVKNGEAVAMKDYVSPCGAPMSFIKTDDGGFLIVCMYGILRYDYATESVSDAGYDVSLLGKQISIRKAKLTKAGDLYVGTTGLGLMVIPHGQKALQQVLNVNVKYDMSTSNVNDIFEDKDHNIWVSCYQKGLYQLNQGAEPFSNWSFSEQNHHIGSSVSSIVVEEGGDVLCTAQDAHVYRFGSHGKITSVIPAPDGSKFLLRDRQGRYWISTENTLYSYSPQTGSSQQRLTGDGWGLNCLADDANGLLYVADFGKGLRIYNPSTGEVESFDMDQSDPKKGTICNNWIKSLFVDRYGMLWIGTANGLSVMDTADRNFRKFGWDVELKAFQCSAFAEQKQGNVLIGTNDGLYVFDRIHNKVSAFKGAEVLKNKLICGISTEDSGDIWISTSMGIWHYSAKTQKWISYVHGSGLATKEYVVGALARKPDGTICLGTNDGITVFRPETVKNSLKTVGDVYLTNFIMGNETVCPLKDKFDVPYDENSFTLEFSLLDYKNVENIFFQYRINGSGPWISTNEGMNAISFNKMKPGRYVVEVRAVCNGIMSKNTKQVMVHVLDPWYSSTLAWFIYALLCMGLVSLAVYYFERKRKAELEESKMRFLINATHDIRSPLTLILGPLKKLKERVTDPDSKTDIDTIDRNAQRLLLLVNQILDERKIDKNQMHLHCRETDLVSFVNGICSLYQYNAQQRNIAFNMVANTQKDDVANADGKSDEDEMPRIPVWIDRINFDKVVSNLLSNAFKYTFDGGQIDVVISESTTKDGKHEAVIEVIDNGIGIKEDKPDRLFDRFYQGSNARDLHLDGTGIGLNLSKAIVQMHGGTISAANRPDGMRGTVLTVHLPMGKGHLKPEEIETEAETVFSNSPKKQASKNFRILIADDDAEIAGYIRAELGNWYRFDAAPNGKEALKALLTSDYDLVISDIMMPEMDGIQLLKSIKSNTNISDIPVILLTSKSEVSHRLEGLKKGADAFLSKPFNMEELHILIDNLVDNVRRLRGKYTGAQAQEKKMKKVTVKGNNDALMDRIMKCINENLSDPDFNVEKLSETVGISRAQLHRKLKEITGISAGDFMRNLRLEQAARLIKEHKINVTQVAYAVGFNNQTHFSTIFKKHFGMTPTEYSEQERNKEDA